MEKSLLGKSQTSIQLKLIMDSQLENILFEINSESSDLNKTIHHCRKRIKNIRSSSPYKAKLYRKLES